MKEVFRHLNCSREGLTAAEGEERLKQFGPNKLEEKKVRIINLFNLLEMILFKRMFISL
jgi:Cation transporter/ATPase, N-terminus